MTVKEKTKPTQQSTTTSLGQWLLVGAILAAVGLLAIRVVDLIGDNDPPAVPVTEVGTEWTLDDEIAAIRGNNRQSQVRSESSSPQWTLEDELAAIRGNGVGQPTQSSHPGEPITSSSGPR